VSASNEEFGLTSEKTMSSQLSLAPLSNVNGRGVMGGSNIVLKGSVNQDPLLFGMILGKPYCLFLTPIFTFCQKEKK